MGIVRAVSFLRGTLIKMDGLRCRMKWKVMFLDYDNEKKERKNLSSLMNRHTERSHLLTCSLLLM